MAYGRRPRLGRLDLLIIGARPKDAQQDVPAVNAGGLTAEQAAELYRLNYRRRVSTLSASEEMLRYRLESLRRTGK